MDVKNAATAQKIHDSSRKNRTTNKLLLNKHFSSRASSSGIGSFEDDHDNNVYQSKKNNSSTQKLSVTALYEDTLDNLDISVILKECSAELNYNSELGSDKNIHDSTFDNDGQANIEDDFSQIFNTQMANQLDNDLMRETNKNIIDESVVEAIIPKNEQENLDLKIPILQSFAEKITTLQARNEEENDKSLIFTDNSVTSLYKKEVANLFQKIEQSICAMGNDSIKSTISDEILDVFFADELNINAFNESKIQEEFNKSSKSIRTPEEALAEFNSSFGSVIKQVLLNNASKSPCDKEISLNPDVTLNRSIDNNVSVLRNLGNFFGLPGRVKDLIKQYKGIEELYDWQKECLNLATINRSNLIYALPTSGGKTLVAEILMLREILCYQKNVIFILPYVAIVQEKVWDFSPFGVALDFLVEEYAANRGSYPPRKRRRKHSVYIATIEKALGLINSLIENGRLNEIGLIVVDELHLIGEEGRGATLEACLSKIMFLKSNIQIVAMSATIGNIQDISKFLNAEVYAKNFRPVKLTEYVKCENEIAKINWKYTSDRNLLIAAEKLNFNYSESVARIDPDMLGGLILQIVPKDSCLVFCPSKKNCENIVSLLCKLTKPLLKEHKKVEKEQLLNALKGEAGELCQILKVSIPFGIAYHHSGLTSEERRLLEDGFRSGIICVICCTSTLAAGVNLPARRVVLRSPYIGRDFLTLSRYKQMIGRAGRAGYGEIGESIVVTCKEDLPKLKELLMSPMNQAISHLHDLEGRGLRHLLLSCISLGIANSRNELQKVARATLMAVQTDRLNINIKKLTDSVIKQLFKLGALQENCNKGKIRKVESQLDVSVTLETSTANSPLEESFSTCDNNNRKRKKTLILTSNTKLAVSSLGIAAIKGGLELGKAHQLYEDLYQAQKSLVLLNCLHLLYLVTPYETSAQIKPDIQVYYNVLISLNDKEFQTAKILGFDEGVLVKMVTGGVSKQIPEGVFNRFYLTLMLYELWNEKPIFQVAEKYQINRGVVQSLMTISATFASNVVNFCEQLEEFWAFSHLLKGMSQRLSHCCIKELISLMELPAVKQTRAKQLYDAGYKNLQSIAKASVKELVESIEFLSTRVASQLIAASKMLLLEKVENLREEAEDVLDGVENPGQVLK